MVVVSSRLCISQRFSFCLLRNPVRSLAYVFFVSIGLSHAKPQGKPTVELRVRQKQIPTLIQPVHDRLIGRVTPLVSKTNQV